MTVKGLTVKAKQEDNHYFLLPDSKSKASIQELQEADLVVEATEMFGMVTHLQ
jgi:hypothetical protein